MGDPSKYYSFTAADIERYYHGTMPAAERHALEKAALDDPFLADALEGYALTSTPVADIAALKKRLEEKHKRKHLPLFSNNYKWLQIAALFLLLAGAGWFLYTADLFNKKEIAVAVPAKQEPPPTFPKAESKPTPGQGAAIPSPQSAPAAGRTQKSGTGTKKAGTENQQARLKANEYEASTATEATAASGRRMEQADTHRLAPNVAASEDRAAALPPAEKNNPVPVTNSRRATTLKDSAAGYAWHQGKVTGVQPVNDTVRLNVTMQPSKEGMGEVVVVDLKGNRAAKAQPVATFEELEPAEGWTNFNEYIAQNLKQPEEVKEKTASGEVELSFEVNKEGHAVNIRVEKSLCGDCDKEAVRLLKEGPKWKNKKGKKGKVTIYF